MAKQEKRTDVRGMEILDESEQQQATLDLMMSLHEAGFTRLWLDSVRMFSRGLDDPERKPQVQHYQLAVIVDETAIGYMELAKLHEIAQAHNATVSLAEVRMHQDVFSRIRLWVRKGGAS